MQDAHYHKPIDSEFFTSFDNLSKQLKQASGVISSLRCDDNYQSINDEGLGNTLWTISDLVDRASTDLDSFWELLKVSNNKGEMMKKLSKDKFPDSPSLNDLFIVNPSSPKKIDFFPLSQLILNAKSITKLVLIDSTRNNCEGFSLERNEILDIIFSVEDRIDQAIKIVEYADVKHVILEALKSAKAILWLMESDEDQSRKIDALRGVLKILDDTYIILEKMFHFAENQKLVA